MKAPHVLSALTILCCNGVVLAAPAPIVSSTQAGEDRPDNAFGLGATYSVAQRPFIGISDQTSLLPYISYKYQDFYIEGLDMGYTVSRHDAFKIDVLATPRFYEVEAAFADNGELDGIEQTKPTYLAGFSAQLKTDFAVYTFQILHDIIESDGNEAVISASKTFEVSNNLALTPSLGLTYQDSALVDHFYGVQSNEVRAGRPLYAGEAAFNTNVTLLATYTATQNIQVLGQFKYESLGSGITDSPVVDEKSIYAVTLGAVYRF